MLDMHPPILVSGVRRAGRVALVAGGLLAAALAVAAPKPTPGVAQNCPAKATLLVEHFIGADCLACWQVAPPGLGAMPVGPKEWSLDWIAPTADDAAMAPGALPEAGERLARVNAELPARIASAPAAFDSVTALVKPSARRRFSVHSSLPHNGYMGVQMHATGVWPAGSTGWIALVEHFIGADCLACWQVAPPGLGAMPVAAREWSLDWIAPTADDAAMAPGALPEAAERLARVNAELPARIASAPAAFDSVTAASCSSFRPRNNRSGVGLSGSASECWICIHPF